MSARGISSPTLERAFRSFERAAVTLEERQASLQHEVERLERELLDAHRRLEAVLDAVNVGIAVVARDGALLRSNRAFDAVTPARRDGRVTEPALTSMIRAANGHAATERIHLNTPNGERDFAATSIAAGDDAGTRVLTLQDVTEIRREAEEGGRRHRLEALGRMAAELAHEVRNPVGSIRLFASMLVEDLETAGEKRSMAEQILTAAAGLEGTVSNLLAFASPPRGTRRSVDLASLAADVCALLGPACTARGVSLEGPGPGEGCVIEGETEGLRQVVLNLLGNALAATRPGGRVHVDVRRVGDRTRLQVRDDGAGIAPDDLPRVFDPFFSRTEGGTGLGLSIVHGIVERHGGRIALESEPDRGTAVLVELPPACGPTPRVARGAEVNPDA